ncbi:hypothetical protein DSAG12_03499 [Promethearchaeum syntrophicum]|uniref:Uncharacterized protein n=1 Tax=Promethearchaeum syntrophicum TaxID=2594042 RepID=A0A5B9DEY3_9ARCH|nr:hypothetical protein [Candidatus Prometheoarchaeum syntrophicum]QEE17662.1 hypothetical protein DSAG12_03499 [Candidatus Prometheoarchaeum syntrophicum]
MSPKRNPKHAKKEFYVRKKQYNEQKIPIKYFAMGFIFVISITGVVLLAVLLPESTNGHGDKLYIEDGDTAELHYKLWRIDDIGDLDTSEEPDEESKPPNNFITEVTKGSLINGFYYELLDSEIGEILEFVIDKETDVDPQDGFDDDTGDEILGYADGTILYFWVQVLNITKSADNTPESSNFTVQVENLSENYLYCNVRKLFPFEFFDN